MRAKGIVGGQKPKRPLMGFYKTSGRKVHSSKEERERYYKPKRNKQ